MLKMNSTLEEQKKYYSEVNLNKFIRIINKLKGRN